MSNKPRILLCNNMPTHHQMFLAENLYGILGESFRIAYCMPVDPERLKMGWQDCGAGLPWVIRLWESRDSQKEFAEWVEEADAVIGHLPGRPMFMNRLANKKLCLVPSERIWKINSTLSRAPGENNFFENNRIRYLLRGYYNMWRYILRLREADKNNCHFLAIGAYSAYDHSRIGVFKSRMWTYGYFTPVPDSNPSKREDALIHILWAGRMARYKSPEVLLKAIAALRTKRPFLVTLIGDGCMRARLIDLTKRLNLQGVVRFLPFVSNEDARKAMRNSHIYVMTSNYEEGWGAVLNEAMAEGCAVVSSSGVGAAPLLIKHGKTGLIFKPGNAKEISDHLKILIDNPSRTHEIGQEAWKYIKALWSPRVAAERIVMLVNGLLGLAPMPDFKEGPCSPAIIMKPGNL